MADKTLSNPQNRDRALKMLKDVISVLDEYKIDYYLDFGTLLGAVREKGFIPWDDDIDISLLKQSDYQKIPAVLKEIEKRFKYKIRLYTFEDAINRCKKECDRNIYYAKLDDFQVAKIKNKTFFGKDLAVLDIFFKYEYNSYLHWYAAGLTNMVDSKFLLNGLKVIKFYDLNCKIPKDFAAYLSAIYGNWQKPDSKWEKSDNLTVKR